MRVLSGLALPVGAGIVAGIALAALGVPREFAWGWALLVVAVILALGARIPDDPRADAPGRMAVRDYVGSDVSRLAWAISIRTDTVNEAVTRRVRATLRRRLLRHGVDVDDPEQENAVERLLGEGIWARLNGHRTTVGDVRDAMAAAERLATSPAQETARRHESTQRETV